jgi:DNA primase
VGRSDLMGRYGRVRGLRFNIADYLLSKNLRNGRIKGDEFQACCPFHHEENPSFAVNVRTGQWLCRASNVCGQKGKSISSLMAKIDRIPMRQAEEIAGTQFRAPLESFEDLERVLGLPKERPVLNGISPPFPPSIKIDPLNQSAYLLNRGYDLRAAQSFGLHLGVRYADDVYRNRFADYLIMPVFDHTGKYISFTARYTKTPDQEHPRYRSASYPVRDYLYGEWLLRNDSSPVFIVEGQFDVMRLWTFGESVLGTFGTSYTHAQIKRLSDLVGERQIIILFDADTFKGEVSGTETPSKLVSTLRSIGRQCSILDIREFGVNDADELSEDLWRDVYKVHAPIS